MIQNILNAQRKFNHRTLNRRAVTTTALFGRPKKSIVEETEVVESSKPKKKQSVISQTLNAIDFAAPRSQKDSELLYDAKYGKRSEDGKMTREQYQALRRKIGGTAKDYFKEWVEEERVENTYYKPDSMQGTVPYLPLLVGVVFAVLGATVVVVQQTGGN
ncbi:hypothetical protein CEUSTIGMA_g3264.t1 [Chlamydomonas eustigma]|uniref:Uncharacterized protein n=1 Tax=Chlamydomonas eustigma TaxID=1157962 RepID=A0A250WYB9_9CHLO|nr:hypothetical protein CEUSTIGMA_g3264.t1 [Chlamydomonas eustigma]|eukprot:GAX75821.1 hypothetical protein CEUSTIGMA_g3264.t1 [Chlamydomonas eustigma]